LKTIQFQQANLLESETVIQAATVKNKKRPIVMAIGLFEVNAIQVSNN